MAFSGSPDNCRSNTSNNFHKFSFVWAQELKIPKNGDFSALPRNCGYSRKWRKNPWGKAEKFILLNLLSILSLFPAGTLLQNIYTLGVTVYNI